MIKYIFSFVAIVAIISIGTVFAAWSGSPGNPPSNNEPAPINVSGTAQTKEGHLTVGAMRAQENVRVGPSTGWSNERLEVNGNIRVRGADGIIFSDSPKRNISSAPNCSGANIRIGWNGSNWTCSPLYNQ